MTVRWFLFGRIAKELAIKSKQESNFCEEKMSFTKKGTFSKNYTDKIDNNVCPKCGKPLSVKKEESEHHLKSSQVCDCSSISNKKTETNYVIKLDEEYKN